MFLNTAAIAKDVCNRWFGLIKAMKPALDDVVTIDGCHISVLNQEQSKLQIITLPEDTMISASSYYRSIYESIAGVKVGEGIAAEVIYPSPQFFWMGPVHYRSLDILNTYLSISANEIPICSVEDLREICPDAMKLTTDSGTSIVQLQPSINIMMIPGIFSAAAKDKVGLDVFQMPNGSILLKFKYYKQSVKAFIDIYMVQLRL